MKNKICIISIMSVLCSFIYCREQEKVDFIPKGHLALSTSQETSPLFCLGQNIVDKGDLQIFAYSNSLLGKNNNFTEVIPIIFYGITDDLALIAGPPIATNVRIANDFFSLRGIESVFVQFEYAFYNDDHPTYANQATIVSNIVAPARPYQVNLPSAFDGAPSYLLGFTVSHMDFDWYYFVSGGVIVPWCYRGQKGNTQFLYQGGISRNLYYVSNKTIVSLLLEFFGTASKQNFLQQLSLRDNSFYIGPSLWIATQHFIFEIGVAFSVTRQHHLGFANTCIFAAEIGWKFND